MRGANEDNILEIQESQLQDHHHIDNGHAHSCDATSKADPHDHLYYASSTYDNYVIAGIDTESCAYGYNRKTTESATISVSTTCSILNNISNVGGISSEANRGIETQPPYMNVHYIIRLI